jgi:hypothetical protein
MGERQRPLRCTRQTLKCPKSNTIYRQMACDHSGDDRSPEARTDQCQGGQQAGRLLDAGGLQT